MSLAQMDKNPEFRLSINDFTKLGLLTAEEIDNRAELTRVMAIQNDEQPKVASLTEYESATSPNGLRAEYNLVAADNRDAQALTHEFAVEASIYNTSGRDIKRHLVA